MDERYGTAALRATTREHGRTVIYTDERVPAASSECSAVDLERGAPSKQRTDAFLAFRGNPLVLGYLFSDDLANLRVALLPCGIEGAIPAVGIRNLRAVFY